MVGHLAFCLVALALRVHLKLVGYLPHDLLDIIHAHIFVERRDRLFGGLADIFGSGDVILGDDGRLLVPTDSRFHDLARLVHSDVGGHRNARIIAIKLLEHAVKFLFGLVVHRQRTFGLEHDLRDFDDLLWRIGLQVELVTEERRHTRVALHETAETALRAHQDDDRITIPFLHAVEQDIEVGYLPYLAIRQQFLCVLNAQDAVAHSFDIIVKIVGELEKIGRVDDFGLVLRDDFIRVEQGLDDLQQLGLTHSGIAEDEHIQITLGLHACQPLAVFERFVRVDNVA